MKLKLIDFPKFIEMQRYSDLTDKIVNEFIKRDEILSIYRMGSIKNLGISDLDVICVFKNGADCCIDFRKNLSAGEKEILTHGLFGVGENFFFEALSYSYLSNLQYLGGKNLKIPTNHLLENSILKEQIALEYLVKLYATLTVQLNYRIVKLRSFLLEAKAVLFDLKLLSIHDGKLFELVNNVIKYRNKWFESDIKTKEISELILSFYDALQELLFKLFEEKIFMLPFDSKKISKNILIKKGSFNKTHTGICLPQQFSFLGKKYINLQHRINQFIFYVPFESPESGSILDLRFIFYKRLVFYNKKHLPAFGSLTTSLKLF
jgi:hypothetical protein